MKINKIAFIGYDLTAGGAEANVINLAYEFINKKIHTDIIIFKNINEYKSQYEEKLNKIKIYPILNTREKINKLTLPFKSILLFIRLFFLVRKNKYQLLIAMVDYWPAYVVVLLARLFKKKSIIILGNNIESTLNERPFINRFLHKFATQISFRNTDKIICESSGLTDLLKNKFKIDEEKVVTIHNGVDIKLINILKDMKIDKKHDWLKKYKILVILGRLVEKKGHKYLLEAFQLINKNIPDTRLIIIGQGNKEKELKNHVKELQLDNKIIFLGFEENPYKYLKIGKIFLFSSLYEGFGNVIVEAMTCELPVVSVDCPFGPKEILGSGKYGILTPNVDTDVGRKSFSDAVIALLKNKKVFFKYKKASIIRSRNFSVDQMFKKYLSLIENL